ncbi:MlaA family lipoprotein [Sulfurospirillum sp.]|uniref:MlaA family lipoprotein n=1 Tax=Sulfurospirillum sp. TaxID=2053622 RepID=UPI002FDEE216
MRLILACLLSLSLLSSAEYMGATSYSSDDFEAEFSSKTDENLFDPLSGYNEIMTSFNDKFYEYLLRPTAQGYAYVVPQMARNGVANFFENIFYPIRLVNNLLQLKFHNSWEETERFVLNSTMGILGFRDVAGEELGIKAHDEDLGQTLGHYGVGSGFHVVLPLFGPSNVRDIAGLAGDMWLNPINYIKARDANLLDSSEEALAVTALYTVNKTSLHVKEYDNFKKDAIELYPFLRNFYESRRNKLISE